MTDEARKFERRCADFAPPTEHPLIPATRRLAWACEDEGNTPWPFNKREVRELRALIDNLLTHIEKQDA